MMFAPRSTATETQPRRNPPAGVAMNKTTASHDSTLPARLRGDPVALRFHREHDQQRESRRGSGYHRQHPTKLPGSLPVGTLCEAKGQATEASTGHDTASPEIYSATLP
jgi:hypothetical protein